MDGNGRWAARARAARRRGPPRRDARALRRTVEAAIDLGVESLAVYAFSTENWARPPDEVETLMEIFGETIDRELPDLAKQGVRTRFFGRRDRAPDSLQAKMARARGGDGEPDRLHLWIAFDYGGRAELVEAVRAARRERRRARGRSTRTSLAAHLYAPELPDPDLVIRTSGELRISNFLLWQLAYAELVFDEDALARLRRGASCAPRSRVRAAAPPVRRAMSPSPRRVLVAVVVARRWCSALV